MLIIYGTKGMCNHHMNLMMEKVIPSWKRCWLSSYNQLKYNVKIFKQAFTTKIMKILS